MSIRNTDSDGARNGPEIGVAMTGRSGYVVAVMPRVDPADLWAATEVLLVGQVRQGGGYSEPDRPQDWTAWLWPVPGWHPRRGQHTDAVKASDEETLTRRLQERAGKRGPWWAGGNASPLPEAGPGLAAEPREVEDRMPGVEPGDRLEG